MKNAKLNKFLVKYLMLFALLPQTSVGDVSVSGQIMLSSVSPPQTATTLAGHDHTVAIKNNGTVWSWGSNTVGQLGIGTVGKISEQNVDPLKVLLLEDITDIAVAYNSSYALNSDGNVWAWGNSTHGTSIAVPIKYELKNIVSISAGGGAAYALDSSGQVWGWGNKFAGSTGDASVDSTVTPAVIPQLNNVRTIATGAGHRFAIKNDGSVWGWGYNTVSQLGNGDSTETSMTPIEIDNLNGFVMLSVDNSGGVSKDSFSLGLKSDGTAWSWGGNTAGQLGTGDTTDSKIPVQIDALSDVVSIAAGSKHGLAVKSDGSVWSWGDNTVGQLGNETFISSTSPVQVAGLSNIVKVYAGRLSSFAIDSSDNIWSWGGNHSGQLGTGRSGSSYNYAYLVKSLEEEDTNANNIPDTWENRHTLSTASDSTDSDYDGISDYDEYINGTDPLRLTTRKYTDSDLSDATSTQIDLCKQNPSSCGIKVTQTTTVQGYTQNELDTAIADGKSEQANTCKNNPTDCGIDVGYTQSEVDLLVSNAKVSCTANPESCGIDLTGYIADSSDSTLLGTYKLTDLAIAYENGVTLQPTAFEGFMVLDKQFILAGVSISGSGSGLVGSYTISGESIEITSDSTGNKYHGTLSKNENGELVTYIDFTQSKGYSQSAVWIKVESLPDSSGTNESAQYTYVLSPNWNLIGGKDATDTSAITSFMTELNADSIWHWDGQWKNYIKGTPEFLNSLLKMEAKKGYFVHVPSQ